MGCISEPKPSKIKRDPQEPIFVLFRTRGLTEKVYQRIVANMGRLEELQEGQLDKLIEGLVKFFRRQWIEACACSRLDFLFDYKEGSEERLFGRGKDFFNLGVDLVFWANRRRYFEWRGEGGFCEVKGNLKVKEVWQVDMPPFLNTSIGGSNPRMWPFGIIPLHPIQILWRKSKS